MKHIKLRIHTFKPVVGFSFFSDAALCNAMPFRSDGYDVWRCYNFFLLKNKKSLLLLIPSDIHLGHLYISAIRWCFIVLFQFWHPYGEREQCVFFPHAHETGTVPTIDQTWSECADIIKITIITIRMEITVSQRCHATDFSPFFSLLNWWSRSFLFNRSHLIFFQRTSLPSYR